MREAILAVAALLLAGCADLEPQSNPAPASSGGAPPPDSAAVGNLAVTVTTPEFQPVEGAEVGVQGTMHAAYTDAKGGVLFQGLEPGSYTVLAALAGYRPIQDRGRIVEIRGGETTDSTLVLERIEIVNASNAYHRSLPFNGFMGCSFAGGPGTVGYTTYCSRGVSVAGQGIRDPNDNSTHFWTVDSILIQGLVHEMKWQPTTPFTAGMLRIGTYTSYSCTGNAAVGQACTPAGAVAEAWGASPVRGLKLEGDAKNLTKNLGKEASQYPRQVRSEVRGECSGSCSPATVVFQQRYEAWVTAFYGLEPDPNFSIFPK